MSLPPSEKTTDKKPTDMIRWLVRLCPVGLFLLFVVGAGVFVVTRPDSPYALSYSLWYADFRFWSPWVSYCCWLIFTWAMVSTVLQRFLIRPLLYQRVASVLFAFLLWLTWYRNATLPLTTLFAPMMSPVFLLIISFALLIIALTIWRVRKKAIVAKSLLLIAVSSIVLGSAPPPRVSTSTGIYDVQSKDDLLNFTAEDIRELVEMEDARTRGQGRPPHPILVYCFEERSFHYTGGRYDNAEIKYRLRVPSRIVPGRTYPLVVHLHGIGEAGNDNMLSLAHLHSILPLMVGPEQQDFFMLVLQVPHDNRNWTFRPRKDGNLDILVVAMDHVIENNPIDERRLSTFGLSSGGNGVWRLLDAYPDKFAAAVPVSSSAMLDSTIMPLLKDTSIWTFKNERDRTIDTNSVIKAMEIVNGFGGFMKLTEFDQGGHAAWRTAMDEYNCFSWMIAQRRGCWFNIPPERTVYQGRSLANSFFAFFLPLGLTVGLLVFQQSSYCSPHVTEYANEEDMDETEPFTADTFRIWTDVTGTKKVNAKIVGFQEDKVRIQSLEGKITTVAIKQLCDADQELIRKIQAEQPLPEGFRRWSKSDGSQSAVAKFVGFQADGKAILQSTTGKTLAVPVSLLGQAEQELLASLQKQSVLPDGFRENGFREWSNFSGTRKIIAKHLGFQGLNVQFELQDGRKISTPIHQFSTEDQVLLGKLMNKEISTT